MNQLRQWARILMVVGWTVIGLGQTATLWAAGPASNEAPGAPSSAAAPDATPAASEPEPLPIYALPYSIVGLLILLGIFTVSAPVYIPSRFARRIPTLQIAPYVRLESLTCGSATLESRFR